MESDGHRAWQECPTLIIFGVKCQTLSDVDIDIVCQLLKLIRPGPGVLVMTLKSIRCGS